MKVFYTGGYTFPTELVCGIGGDGQTVYAYAIGQPVTPYDSGAIIGSTDWDDMVSSCFIVPGDPTTLSSGSGTGITTTQTNAVMFGGTPFVIPPNYYETEEKARNIAMAMMQYCALAFNSIVAARP